MEPSVVAGAVAAAIEVASSLGLRTTDATVLQSANRLTLRLTPCDALARVTYRDRAGAQLELDRARRLAVAGCPVGVVDPRTEPVVHTRGDLAVTLWTYYAPATSRLTPADYARALVRLHAGMASAAVEAPRFTERVAVAEHVVVDPDLSPDLSEADRALLSGVLGSAARKIVARGREEQPLHGEPHPYNVLSTSGGPVFVDLETICRGPVELDLAHVPEAVCEHYPLLDRALLDDCRGLVLAVVAAWRWQRGDAFPDRDRWRRALLGALRQGPPWPTLDTVTRRLEGS